MPGPVSKPFEKAVGAAEVRVRGAAWRRRAIALFLGLAGLAAAVLGIGGFRWIQAELARSEREIHQGQIGPARARLDRLAMFGLGGHERNYWLGACEEADGHASAALALWARIPPDSSRFANATIRRARLAFESGRFAEAERALESADFPRGSIASTMRESQLQQLDLFTGR